MRLCRLAAAVLFILAAASLPAAAADRDVIFEEEAPDAEKGRVHIRAVVEEGYEADIGVDLIAAFDGGTVHQYLLSDDNYYGVSDDIAVGGYTCVPYLEDEGDTAETCVEYGGYTQEVTKDGTACFVVVAGSSYFVREYVWQSAYRDENGNSLKGVIKRSEAEDLSVRLVALQDGEYPSWEEGQVEELGPSQDDGSEEAVSEQVPVPQPSEPTQEESLKPKIAAGLAAAVLIALAVIAWKKLKK